MIVVPTLRASLLDGDLVLGRDGRTVYTVAPHHPRHTLVPPSRDVVARIACGDEAVALTTLMKIFTVEYVAT